MRAKLWKDWIIGQHLVKNDSPNQPAKCVSRDLIEHKIYDLKMASFLKEAVVNVM